MTRRVLAALFAVSTLSAALPARAQLARQLDDPSGRGPRVTREAPEPPSGPYVPPPSSVPIESSVATRLRALESSFQTLGASGPDYTGTVLSMVGGGITIALAAVLLELGPPIDRLAPYYFVMGGVGVVRPAIVDFALRPDARGPAIEFQHMPGGTEQEQLDRLRFGEEQLESLAERSFIARVVDASINIAGALAVIPAYLIPRVEVGFDPPNEFSPLEAFVFLGPAISLVGAIITFATQSPAEQRWSAYRRMRDRLEDED